LQPAARRGNRKPAPLEHGSILFNLEKLLAWLRRFEMIEPTFCQVFFFRAPRQSLALHALPAISFDTHASHHDSLLASPRQARPRLAAPRPAWPRTTFHFFTIIS
jgi:hypothetical protein